MAKEPTYSKELDCILGCCSHKNTTNTKCIFYKKIVDAEFPEKEQKKLIMKIINNIKKEN